MKSNEESRSAEEAAAERIENQLGALETADVLRRRWLASDAVRNGFPPMTRDKYLKLLDTNMPMLLEIAARIGVKDEEAEQFIREGKELLAKVPHKSDFDDPGLVWVLQMFLNEITAVCSDLSLPFHGGIAIGATPLAAIIARQMRAFCDASFIELTISLMRLCDLVAKAMANTIEHTQVDGKLRLHFHPVNIRKRLQTETWILDEWRRIIRLFATHGYPPRGVGPAPEGAAKNTRVLLTEAMELWVIAHEVCHHVLKHGTDDSTAKNLGPFEEERQADLLSRILLMGIAKRRNTLDNEILVSGAGAALFLGATDLVERAKAVLDTGNDAILPNDHHPLLHDRLEAIHNSDVQAFGERGLRFGIFRLLFVNILDIVWELLKPSFEEMHRKGVQPFRPTHWPNLV